MNHVFKNLSNVYSLQYVLLFKKNYFTQSPLTLNLFCL